MLECPKCKATDVGTEKRPNGDSTCYECLYKDKTEKFKPKEEPKPIDTTGQVYIQ